MGIAGIAWAAWITCSGGATWIQASTHRREGHEGRGLRRMGDARQVREPTEWSRHGFWTPRVPSVTDQSGTAARGYKERLHTALFVWRGNQFRFLWYPNISYVHVNIDWRSVDTRISSNVVVRRPGPRGVVGKKYRFLMAQRTQIPRVHTRLWKMGLARAFDGDRLSPMRTVRESRMRNGLDTC